MSSQVTLLLRSIGTLWGVRKDEERDLGVSHIVPWHQLH